MRRSPHGLLPITLRGAWSLPIGRARTQDEDRHWRAMVTWVSQAYRAADGHAARFARSKLLRDPVFRHVLREGLIAPGATVLDVGCGQGLLATCLAAAAEAQCRGSWPPGWAPAPAGARVVGLDLSARQLHRAAVACRGAVRLAQADMRSAVFPVCDVVAFIDTLHYLPLADQEGVLQRAVDALRPGGVLLLRVSDSSSPLRWRLGLGIDRLTRGLGGGGFEPVHGRSLAAWRGALQTLGLVVDCRAMNGRLPFVNQLLVGRRRGESADPASADGHGGDHPDDARSGPTEDD